MYRTKSRIMSYYVWDFGRMAVCIFISVILPLLPNDMLWGYKAYLDCSKTVWKGKNTTCFIQSFMTSLSGIWVGIPVRRINFPNIENDLLCNLSEFSDVTLGYNQNKEVVSSREGNSKHHRLFSEFIYTHDISYISQYFLVSSSAVWSVDSLEVMASYFLLVSSKRWVFLWIPLWFMWKL